MNKTNRETSSLFTRKSDREHTAPQCCYTVYLRARLWLLHHPPSDLTSSTHPPTHPHSEYVNGGLVWMVGSDLITHVPPGPLSSSCPLSILSAVLHEAPAT